MNARALSMLIIVLSGLVLLWIVPQWVALADADPHRAVLPPPQTGGSGAAVDSGCAAAVAQLSAVPHPPVVAGGQVRAATVNGVPIANCVFQTHGACVDVMDFYLSQLAAHGWQDVSDEHFKPPEGGVHDDAEAEKYDALRSTHALLVKKGRTLALTLKPAPLSRCSVNITCADTTDLPGLWEAAFQKSETLARKNGAGAWLNAREPRSDGASGTRFYTGRGSPDDLIAGIATDMRKEGWNAVLPPRDDNPHEKACMFIKPGGAWAFATVQQDERGFSRGVLFIQ